jgi:hypothetical protein
LLCGSSCASYLTALQDATALANAASATSGSSSGFKLPTIIPLFGMKGSACTPPTAGGSTGNPRGMGMGTFCGMQTCATGEQCCSQNGMQFCSTMCPIVSGPDGGGDAGRTDAGSQDAGGGADSGTQQCATGVQQPDTLNNGNCIVVDQCPASKTTYKIQCMPTGATPAYSCSCFRGAIPGNVVQADINYCQQLDSNPNFIQMFLSSNAFCNYGTIQ